MHEVEEEVLRELYTPPPGLHLGETKKEEETVDAALESLSTPPPERSKEEVTLESQDEEYSLCSTFASPLQNMPALTPPHQTYDYWPPQLIKCFVSPQPFVANVVAGITGKFCKRWAKGNY